MRENRGIIRCAAVLVGGAVVLAGLTGCARKSEDLEEQVAKDPAVSSIESGPDGVFQVTLDDTARTDLAEVSRRLSDLVESVTDDDVALRLRSGAWQWKLSDDDDEAAELGQAVGEFAGIEGVLQSTLWSDDDALGIEAVAAAGVDPAALIAPLADAAAAGPLDGGVRITVSDVHDRSSVETQNPAVLAPVVETIAAVAAIGPIQKYTLDDDSLSLRMRTVEDAASVTPLTDALAAGGSSTKVTLTSGIMTADPPQQELADRLSAVLLPIDGVVGASINTHGPAALHLSVTTTDAESAATVQQTLLATPDLQEFNSLQLSVLKQDEPGSLFTAKTMSEEGYVANIDRARGLASTDGVRSVAFGPLELDVVLDHGADVSELAPAIKTAALRDQEAEIYGSTSWGPITDRTLFSFDVLGKLHENLMSVSAGTADGDVQGFIDAWNEAAGL